MASVTQETLEQSLFIVTPITIYHHSWLGNKTLFDCATPGGIVNARVSRDNSSLFAVADSHVVILCDAARGSKTYRLKKVDVRHAVVKTRLAFI
jgi:hypothetical protein